MNRLYWLGILLAIPAAFLLKAGESLLAGLVLASILQLAGREAPSALWSAAAKKLLPLSIVFIGAGLRFDAVLQTGIQGAASTLVTLAAVFAAGHALGRVFGTPGRLSTLLSAGTGICGGSAIAAMGPAIGASGTEMGIAMTVVFLLNAAALWLFPLLGHELGLTQEQFGQWAALAIHDTSSVVGAASAYGAEALSTATLLKLTRALWILPLVLAAGAWLRRRNASGKGGPRPPFPKFILGFLTASALFTFVPQLEPARAPAAALARGGLVASLFWIGVSLDIKKLKVLGVRSIAHAVLLWILTAGATLAWIIHESTVLPWT